MQSVAGLARTPLGARAPSRMRARSARGSTRGASRSRARGVDARPRALRALEARESFFPSGSRPRTRRARASDSRCRRARWRRILRFQDGELRPARFMRALRVALLLRERGDRIEPRLPREREHRGERDSTEAVEEPEELVEVPESVRAEEREHRSIARGESREPLDRARIELDTLRLDRDSDRYTGQAFEEREELFDGRDRRPSRILRRRGGSAGGGLRASGRGSTGCAFFGSRVDSSRGESLADILGARATGCKRRFNRTRRRIRGGARRRARGAGEVRARGRVAILPGAGRLRAPRRALDR